MDKNSLRKIYKAKRANLTKEQIEEFEISIFHKIRQIDFKEIKNIHIFLPIEKQKEINTYPIIDFLKAKDKNIIISKSNFKTNTLKHFILDDSTILEVNKWGIPEPINAKEIQPSEIDLVFVPLLISDRKNFRVGYGKGFYDRFLSECKPSVKTIGINFFEPIIEISDINKFDFPLDQVIFP